MQVHIQPFLSILYGYHQENWELRLLDDWAVKTGDQQRSSFHTIQRYHISIRYYIRSDIKVSPDKEIKA